MSSKVNLKSSKQSRPKSSDKLKTGKKGGGTPEKASTPNLSQDTIGEDTRPQSQNVISGEEIEKLAIKEEDLQKLHEPQPPKEVKRTTPIPVTVRKLRPAEELEQPKPKQLTVFKPAPPNAPLRPMDYSGVGKLDLGEKRRIAGPRYDLEGAVLPYSILGPYEDFRNEAIKRGDLLDIPISRPEDIQPRCPSVKYEKKPRSSRVSRSSQDEDNALRHWQVKMRQRKKQQGYISKLLQKSPQSLVMNQADTYYQTQEQRYIIDRTIPAVDYGKGYRVGSEFWKQQETVGNEMTGLHMTLSQSERGYPPPIQHVGIPDVVKAEKGYWSNTKAAPVYYPWHRSPYLECRKKQLQPIINQLDPHQPEFESLAVVGSSKSLKSEEDEVTDQGVLHAAVSQIHEAGDMEREGPMDADPYTDPLTGHPDVHPEPVFGPSLLFAGQPARWTGDTSSLKDEPGIEARVTFENYAGSRVTSFLEITNDGTTSIYYNWKQLPKQNPFDLVHAKVQRFYFNTSDGVILPGDTMRFPFVFKSPNAGVFSEQWRFETRPVVCGGASLIVSLCGVALQEDKFKLQRDELEVDLSHKQAQQVVSQILNDVLEGIQLPEPPRSPMDAYITEKEIFTRLNPECYYHFGLVEEMKEMYRTLFPEDQRDGKEWNLSILDMKQQILEMEDDDADSRQTLLHRLNLAVIDFSFSSPRPIEDNRQRVGYQLLVEAVDGMVKQAANIRSVLGLPESEEEDQEESLCTINLEQPEFDLTKRKRSMSDSKRHKHVDKKEQKDAPKKNLSAKDTKAGKGKEPPRPESKGKGAPPTPAPPKKIPATPAKVDSAHGRERPVSPPASPMESPSHQLKDLELHSQYKEKLYSQTYQILGEMMDRLEASLQEIHEVEGAPDLETLIYR